MKNQKLTTNNTEIQAAKNTLKWHQLYKPNGILQAAEKLKKALGDKKWDSLYKVY